MRTKKSVLKVCLHKNLSISAVGVSFVLLRHIFYFYRSSLTYGEVMVPINPSSAENIVSQKRT